MGRLGGVVIRRRLEAVGELPCLTTRNGSDGKRYPAAPKPIVITSSNAQAADRGERSDRAGGDLSD